MERETEERIYLDYSASTPVDPKILDCMLPFFHSCYGNPGSITHDEGREASIAVEEARQKVADVLGASMNDIIFTSGATESINLALTGVSEYYAQKGKHIISVKSEHKANLDTLEYLEKRGWEITLLDVDDLGHIDLEVLQDAIREDTVLVSIMHGNNEIGTLHPIEAIGSLLRKHSVFFHVDAAQTFGKVPIDVEAMNIDLCSISGHKIYGPKGVGALYVRRRKPHVRMQALIHGGGHERGLRSGTLNVPGIVGLSEAGSLARTIMQEESEKLQKLARELFEGLNQTCQDVFLNGDPDKRVPGHLSIRFPGIQAQDLLCRLPNLAMSLGSACSSGLARPSHVLRALRFKPEESLSSLRLAVGRFTKGKDIENAVEWISHEIHKLRKS